MPVHEAVVAEAVARYTPVGVPPEAARFARATVAAAGPATVARAKAWLYAAGRVASFAVSVGLQLEPEVVLSAAVIERFVLQLGPAVPVSTRRTVRSALRTLSKRANPAPPPTFVSRDRVKKPYGPGEIAGFLRLADAQPTPARRMKANG